MWALVSGFTAHDHDEIKRGDLGLLTAENLILSCLISSLFCNDRGGGSHSILCRSTSFLGDACRFLLTHSLYPKQKLKGCKETKSPA